MNIKYHWYTKVVLKLLSNSNAYLQISGEKKNNGSSLLTSGENCVLSTFLNTKKKYNILFQFFLKYASLLPLSKHQSSHKAVISNFLKGLFNGYAHAGC